MQMCAKVQGFVQLNAKYFTLKSTKAKFYNNFNTVIKIALFWIPRRGASTLKYVGILYHCMIFNGFMRISWLLQLFLRIVHGLCFKNDLL